MGSRKIQNKMAGFLLWVAVLFAGGCISQNVYQNDRNSDRGRGDLPGVPTFSGTYSVAGGATSQIVSSDRFTAFANIDWYPANGVQEGETYLSADPMNELQIEVLEELVKN